MDLLTWRCLKDLTSSLPMAAEWRSDSEVEGDVAAAERSGEKWMDATKVVRQRQCKRMKSADGAVG